MLKVFPKPPMLTFKKPPNMRNVLCHAKLPIAKQTKRTIEGIKLCNELCTVCPYIKSSKSFQSSQTKENF